MGFLASSMRLRWVSFVVVILALLSALDAEAQTRPIPFRQLQDSLSIQARPVLLLLSTDWCVYCRMQKFQVQRNKKFLKESSRFYYVELNAESKEPLKFKGKTYYYRPSGESSGVHELAVMLGRHNGTLAYPTWVVLDENLNILYRHSGVLSRKELQLLTESLLNLQRR